MADFKKKLDGGVGFISSFDSRVHTYEQLLGEMPFSPEIRQWFDLHPEVKNALKIIVRERFIPIRAISIVNNPLLSGVKQSIGIYSIDTKDNNQIKQDYLMHQDDNIFVFFSGLPPKVKASTYVRHIRELRTCYGPDGLNYYNDHHQTLAQVSHLVRPYIEAALALVL